MIYSYPLFEYILTESVKEFNLIEYNYNNHKDMTFFHRNKDKENDILIYNKEYKIGFNYTYDGQSMWISYDIFKIDMPFGININLYKFLKQLIISKFPQYIISGFHVINADSVFYINAQNYLKHKYAL